LFFTSASGACVFSKHIESRHGQNINLRICIAIPAVIIAGPFLGKQLRRLKLEETNLLFLQKAPVIKDPPMLAKFFNCIIAGDTH